MTDDPIGVEKRRLRRLAEIKDAKELARLLRESRELLRKIRFNEVDAALELIRKLPHRSEYPGHVPGDQQWYELDNPEELALWRTVSVLSAHPMISRATGSRLQVAGGGRR